MPKNNTALIRAIRTSDLSLLKKLHRKGVDLDYYYSEKIHVLASLFDYDGDYISTCDSDNSSKEPSEEYTETSVKKDSSSSSRADSDADADADSDSNSKSASSSSDSSGDDESESSEEAVVDSNTKRIQLLAYYCQHSSAPKIVAQVVIICLEKSMITANGFWTLLKQLTPSYFFDNYNASFITKVQGDGYTGKISILTCALNAIAVQSPDSLLPENKTLLIEFLESLSDNDSIEDLYRAAIQHKNDALVKLLIQTVKPKTLFDTPEQSEEESEAVASDVADDVEESKDPLIVYAVSKIIDEDILDCFINWAKDDLNQQFGSTGATLLVICVRKKNSSAVRLLIQNGADIDQTDNSGATPIHAAADCGYDKILEILLAAKPNLDLQDHRGNSALHLAASKGAAACIRQLLAVNANRNLKNLTGQLALHRAVLSRHFESLSLLCAGGSQHECEDHQGNTPLHLAVQLMLSQWHGLEMGNGRHDVDDEELNDAKEGSDSQSQESSSEHIDLNDQFFVELVSAGYSILAVNNTKEEIYQVVKTAISKRRVFDDSETLQKFAANLERLKKYTLSFSRIVPAFEHLSEDEKKICDMKLLKAAYINAVEILFDRVAVPSDEVSQNPSDSLFVVEKKLETSLYISGAAYQIYVELNKLRGKKLAQPLNNFDILGDANYTFIMNIQHNFYWCLIPLKQSHELKEELLVILLYQAARHTWESEKCSITRLILNKLSHGGYPADLKQEDAQNLLHRIETAELATDFYSDDSDNEQIKKHEGDSRGVQANNRRYAEIMMERAQLSAFFTKELKLRVIAIDKVTLNLTERQEIFHEGKIPPDVMNDLSALNNLFRTRRLTTESVRSITTKFYIAQYRGIHYCVSGWNADTRRQHRSYSELMDPYFSRAVIQRVCGELNVDYKHLAPNVQDELTKQAVLLHHQMTALSFAGKILVHSKNNDPFFFDSPIDAIQDVYTKDYQAYHAKLRHIAEQCDKGALITDVMDAMYLFATNHKTPNVSTADAPHHAWKYALGLKSYKRHPTKLLEPRWHRDGKAERPYSGKVYTFLFEPFDYHLLRPNHLVSLNRQGSTKIDLQKIPERESTFAAYIPKDKLIYEKKARFPSFHRPYSEHFLLKYGMNKEMYAAYQSGFNFTTPHSPEREKLKSYLGEHLCAYNEVMMIEDARIAARNNDGWLIYRSQYNEFSLVLPRLNTDKHSSTNPDQALAARLQQDDINNEKSSHMNVLANENKGWLTLLLETYDIRAAKDLIHLLCMLDLAQKETRLPPCQPSPAFHHHIVHKPATVKIEIINDTFNQHCQLLQNIANLRQVNFKIHSMLFASDLTIQSIGKQAKTIHEILYLGGDGFHGLNSKMPQQHLQVAQILPTPVSPMAVLPAAVTSPTPKQALQSPDKVMQDAVVEPDASSVSKKRASPNDKKQSSSTGMKPITDFFKVPKTTNQSPAPAAAVNPTGTILGVNNPTSTMETTAPRKN